MKSLGLIVLTWVAFAWRLHGLTWQSLWRDEVDAIYFATRHLPETLAMFVQPGQNGALYFVALRPWFNLVGTSEFALRYPSAMAGVLCVLLTWHVARRLLPLAPMGEANAPARAATFFGGASPLAWLAAALMALNPYQLWYGQEGKMYTVITALVLLATWWWLEGIRRGGWRPWLAYLLTVSVAMYTHLLLILLFPVHFVWFWLAWPQSRLHWRGYALALAGLTLPYLPMVWWQWALLTANVKRTGFTFTPPLEMARTILYNHSRGFMPPEDLLWLIPIFFLGAAGVVLGMGEIAARGQKPLPNPPHPYRTWLGEGTVSSYAATLSSARVGEGIDSSHAETRLPPQSGEGWGGVSAPARGRIDSSYPATWLPPQAMSCKDGEGRGGVLSLSPWRRWAMVMSWALIPVVGIYALSLRQPIFTDRYVIWIAPALMMLVALGLVVVRRYAWIFGRVLAAGLLVYVLGFWIYAGWQQKTESTKYDLRGGVSYLAEHRTPNSLLILQIPHMEWAYRYYTSDFGPRPFAGSDARLASWMGGVWTNQGWPDDTARLDVAQQMAVQTAGYSDVWVLRSEVEMWDQRHLMDEWLDEQGELIDQADFHGVQVRHYRLHRETTATCTPAIAQSIVFQRG